METFQARIESGLALKNRENVADYEFAISIGASRFDKESNSTIESMLRQADQNMYRKKSIKKRNALH
ncbi:MAG: diguanylate cyclase domain-containing protein [Spirochaetota bacterium]